MCRSSHIRSVELGDEYWSFRPILKHWFLFNFQLKKIRYKKSTNHSYWALKLYVFWVKVLIASRCPKCKIQSQFFFSWKLKENKDSKFNENFNIVHQLQHFEYDMIHAIMFEWICLSLFFSDKKTKVVQEVTMFQHITWPDYGIPKDLFSIFELIHVISQINSNCKLVHCSAGIGRTGVFLALAKLIETFHSDAHYLNIFQTVLELRKSRKFMVNNVFIRCFTNLEFWIYDFFSK